MNTNTEVFKVCCQNPHCEICTTRSYLGVSFERTREGWVFQIDGKTFGPVKDVYTLDPLVLAEALGIDTHTAIAVRLKVSEFETLRPLTIDDLAQVLEATIKRDYENKIITFLCMLSAYLGDEQFNLSFRAESSTGKSYIPIEVAQLFPPEDVLMIAYSSPTAFFHETGTWDEDERAIFVDLEHKILIFLDQPHDQLLERLRPLLSHDQKILTYKITDKKEKIGLRTKTVKIRGFPAVIFCTGRLRTDEQEATRMILLSPETSQEKLREAVFLKFLREGDRSAFRKYLEREYPDRKVLRERIKYVRAAKIEDVKIPNIGSLANHFIERRKILKPRHTRDAGRLISLIKVLALLNFPHRRREGNVLMASEEDIQEALKLYERISESQELGLPPYVLRIYRELILPAADRGISRRELMTLHLKIFGRPLPEHVLRREVVPALIAAGLVVEEPDPDHKQRLLIKPIISEETTPPSCPVVSGEAPQEEPRDRGVGYSVDSVEPREHQEPRDGRVGYWNPGPGLCELCGEEVADRYAVKTRWGVRFLCRACASELEAQGEDGWVACF